MDDNISPETLRAIIRARVRIAADGTPMVAIAGARAFAWPGTVEVRGVLRQCLNLDRHEARHAAEELAEVVSAALREREEDDNDFWSGGYDAE